MKRDIARIIAKTLDVLLMAAIAGWVLWHFYKGILARSADPRNTLVLMMAMCMGAFLYSAQVFSAFNIMVSQVSGLIYSQTLSTLVTGALMYLLLIMINGGLPNPLPMLLLLALQFAAICLWSFLSRWYYSKNISALRTLFVYGKENQYEAFMEEYGFRQKFDIQRVVSLEEFNRCKDMESLWDGMQTVLVSDMPLEERHILISRCYEHNIGIYYLPSVSDVLLSSALAIDVCHHPIFRIYRYKAPNYLAIKRLGDILLSGIALVLASPIMLLTAAAIHFGDGGPVFYRQKRVTENGRVFEILKFRSMRVDAEKESGARLSSGSADDRITPVGRFIRMVRIDELPQLLNIIKGDMSIVGPRPERPELVEQYLRELPEFNLRLRMKAGLTGYAQVYGKYNTTPNEKLLMDLIYITNSNLQMDIELMLATVKILFMPESTEGIAEGQTTAMKK